MSIEVRLDQWIGLENREKYMRRHKGKCDIFFWDRTQIEEGGSGGAVQQRSQRRMEKVDFLDPIGLSRNPHEHVPLLWHLFTRSSLRIS